MKSYLQQFYSEEFGKLDVLTIDGKMYFPAIACTEILGYKKSRNAIARHCRDSLKRGVIDSRGREQETNFISEGDLYRLIMRSRLPAAERFERWVFDEVLPSIRKYGAYATDSVLDEIRSHPEMAHEFFRQLKAEKEKRAKLEQQMETIAPKATYSREVLHADDALPVSAIALDYGVTTDEFNELLHDLNIQYRLRNTWLLYQKYANEGYTKSFTYKNLNGEAVMMTLWTPKGCKFLEGLLASFGIFPVARSGQAVSK